MKEIIASYTTLVRRDHQENSGNRLIASSFLRSGTVVNPIVVGQVLHYPTQTSFQIDQGRHLEDAFVSLINHSCVPNIIIDLASTQCRAIRDIAIGEELSFFYPSTEWEMSHPFICHCGHLGCIGVVAGAKFLSPYVLSRYFINQHIKKTQVNYEN